MEEGFILLIFIIVAIILFAWIEWSIGALIGRNVSRLTGVILGVILILIGFSFLIGIACIIYSQSNANAAIDVNANLNHRHQSEETECPYCAETIKKNAIICRYCNNKI